MRRFVEQADRGQWTLLPECLDDFIDESNPVRVIDVFVDALDLAEMSFEGVEPAAKAVHVVGSGRVNLSGAKFRRTLPGHIYCASNGYFDELSRY